VGICWPASATAGHHFAFAWGQAGSTASPNVELVEPESIGKKENIQR